ncbi:E2F transcription factor 5 [Phyllostomus discolor]|uniref:E2F transcription factor 5 n=1 Tax=Phyllostomus discolor TaxID=89673 RepID=A0A833ZUP9_9CHIR|nr:E2F transcription factor 5 [Phyllostomus discolor]
MLFLKKSVLLDRWLKALISCPTLGPHSCVLTYCLSFVVQIYLVPSNLISFLMLIFIHLVILNFKGQNGQKKYQINLKSHSGPIHVLLINKESSSSQPVVFPVPPPDDLTQPSSRPSTPRTSHKPSPATRRPPEQPTPEKDQGSQHMPATDLASAGSISGDIIDELMSSDVFPLLRLSPTPADDYNFNLDDNEGVCDLFDVQILNY